MPALPPGMMYIAVSTNVLLGLGGVTPQAPDQRLPPLDPAFRGGGGSGDLGGGGGSGGMGGGGGL